VRRGAGGAGVEAHTSTGEAAHSEIRRAVIGVFHWIGGKHLERYLGEIAGAGSLYWVAGGQICGRQKILGFDEDADAKGTFCVFRLDPEIVEVRLTPRRAFQGWRYLTDEDAPADLDLGEGRADDAANMPDEMRAHLRAIGVL